MKPDTQVNLMRRYLLGDLPEPESNELEICVLGDDEKFEEMWEIENQLVEDYVRDRLTTPVRERFERHYLESPVHQQRVVVARNLVEEADRENPATVAVPAKFSSGVGLFEKLGFSFLSLQAALVAAVLVLTMGGLWLLLERTRLRREQDQLRSESQSRHNNEEALSRQLETVKREKETLES